MKVIYVLVVLAKGTEFQKKPIIPLFTVRRTKKPV